MKNASILTAALTILSAGLLASGQEPTMKRQPPPAMTSSPTMKPLPQMSMKNAVRPANKRTPRKPASKARPGKARRRY